MSVLDDSLAPQRAPALASPASKRAPRLSLTWLGVAPFFTFALLFLILPTGFLVLGAFQNPAGEFTLENIAALFTTETIANAYGVSMLVSAASAITGAFVGFFLAYAVVLGRLPSWIRPAVMTFSGVASNFAGVPLAFAFTATLGAQGLLTIFLRDRLGLDLYSHGFTIWRYSGLIVVYLYFQIPLMVLIITPALEGIKKEWREASTTLGATSWQYWWHVAIPILMPSLFGATLLLFANAFGAIATAYALSTSFPLITVQLFAQIRGDVFYNPNLAYAIALGMIVITGLSSGGYLWLRARSGKWLR